MAQSKKYKLNKEDMIKLGKGALLSLTGILLDFSAELVFSVDFGELTPVVYAATPILANFIRKLIAGK